MKMKIFYVTIVFLGLYLTLYNIAKLFSSVDADRLIFYVILIYVGSLMSSLNLTIVNNESLKMPKIIYQSSRHTVGAILAYVIFTTVITFPIWAAFDSIAALIVCLLIGMICFDVVILIIGVPDENTMLFTFIKNLKQ